MHNDMNVCHLDLTINNIMIENGTFLYDDKTGKYKINPSISIKIGDFGLSEKFKYKSNVITADEMFNCDKWDFTSNVRLKSPQIFNEEIYDARKADTWSMGVILYEMTYGIKPFNYHNKEDPSYYCITHNKIKLFLKKHKLLKYSNDKLIYLLNGLLSIYEYQRFNINDIINHEWLNCYFKKYKNRIEQYSYLQQKRIEMQTNKLFTFPYYPSYRTYRQHLQQ